MENLDADIQQLNVYQQKMNDSTKNGPMDQETHQKQQNLLQDLMSKGVALGSELVYDVEEEKYKLSEALQKAREALSDEWHQFIARVSGQTVEEVKAAEQDIAAQAPTEPATSSTTPEASASEPSGTASTTPEAPTASSSEAPSTTSETLAAQPADVQTAGANPAQETTSQEGK